jgi:integrase
LAAGSKNLAEIKTRQKQAAGATKPTKADIKGKIIEYAWWLKKQGYKCAKNRVAMFKRLVDLGANPWDPESVKDVLASQTEWSDSYKMLLTYAYQGFLEMEGLSWKKPRYKQEEFLPFIPTEEELNQLIFGVGRQIGTFLQGLKDTGADPGELAKLRWIDLNKEARTVNIRPVKGHNPRILRVSEEFLRRVGALPRKSEYIFNYESVRSCYTKSRKTLARKLRNPRLLNISFTTFRHWKGTMEYHKTRDPLHVKQLLGHKNIQNTMVYVNLDRAIFTSKNDEFHAKVAKNAEEACKLVQVGFEYVTGEYSDGGKIFRKRK